jgi:hypothetical protein
VSLSASEFYEAGMALPPDVRKDVAMRLLRSVVAGDDLEGAAEDWLHTGAAAAYDALEADPSRAVPADEVRGRLEDKWAARP